MKFVLDCSVTMAWCFEDEINAYTEKVLTALQKNHEAKVPPLWKLEVINTLLGAQRKKRISLFAANNFKNALTSLPVQVDHASTDRSFDTVFELACQLQLSAYDAAYLELAFREKIPLATLDMALLKAAKKLNIERFL